MTRATAKLKLDWTVEKEEIASGKLDVHEALATSYSNVKGLVEHGYEGMTLVEDALASHLVPGVELLWKAPTLPSRSCQTLSKLVGKAYVEEPCTP